jgi:DnaD/phage-associated family protein
MPSFNGFPEGKVHLTPIPEPFFTELLYQIDHLGELKLTLYIFWRLARMEAKFRYLRRSDISSDERLMNDLADTQSNLDECLRFAVQRGTLLAARLDEDPSSDTYYFLNTPKGRAAAEAIQNGLWHPTEDQSPPGLVHQETPNIYRLYEDNIGPISPMIADALKEAEDTYPIEWIEDAIRIAVENNKRSWRYAAAILERWHREGRDVRKEKQKDRRDSEEDHRKYITGKYSDFVEH